MGVNCFLCMNKKSTFIKDWEDSRKMGRLKYALLHGSIFGFIVGSFAMLVANYTSASVNLNLEELVINYVLFFGISIVGYYIIIWPINEYYFKRYLSKYKTKEKRKT